MSKFKNNGKFIHCSFYNTPKASVKNKYPLHWLIKVSNNLKEITAYLETLDKKAVYKIVTTVDSHGKLPYDLIGGSPLNDQDRKMLQKILLQYTKKEHVRKISELLDFNKIVKRYPCEENSELYQNLKNAYLAANITRKRFKLSGTHLEANNYDQALRTQILYEIKNIRNDVDKQIAKINLDEFSDKEAKKAIIELIIDAPLKEGIDNCREFAYTALYYLKLKNIHAKAYRIQFGDHTFLIIGKGITDPNAVVCDAWGGYIYPFSQAKEKLINYRPIVDNYSNIINVTTFYNPEYHAIKRDMFIQKSLNHIRNNKCLVQ